MLQMQKQEKENRRKEVLDYAKKLSCVLEVKKRRVVLEADIWSNFKEIEHINYKNEKKQNDIDETIISIEKIEPELFEIKDKFNRIEPENNRLEDEYKRLLEIQSNLGKKKSDLEKNRIEITKLNSDIKKAEENIKISENKNQDVFFQKEEIEKKFNSNKEKLEKLKAELSSYKNTKQLMEGIKPESINTDEFNVLYAADNADGYKSDVMDITKKIKIQITDMKSQINEIYTREKDLTTNIKTFENKIAESGAQKTTDKDKETLKSDINILLEKQNALISEIETNREKTEKQEFELSEIKQKLEKEIEFEKKFTEKFGYFNKRKQEMDGFDDIELEMKNLELRKNKNDREIIANNNFLKIINRVKKEKESLNKSVTIRLEEAQDKINNYKHLLLLKHN